MSQISFSPEWLRQFSDPYAVLGLSVTADDRRVLKRYRMVAKLLHPDGFAASERSDRERASQLFARLVNPTYQKLKQDKGRAENLAMLRFQVRRMEREGAFAPRSEVASALLKTPAGQIDVFYEQAITDLAEAQYNPLAQFEFATHQLSELNLVYLRLKMGEPLIREKRTGLVATADPRSPAPSANSSASSTESQEKPAVDYALRHFLRAQEYVQKQNWLLAVRELQDAIKIAPQNSEYHALLGKAYLMQDLPTMAKVHLRRALKLNPTEPLALQYAKRLNLSLETSPPSSSLKSDASGHGGFFGLFVRKP